MGSKSSPPPATNYQQLAQQQGSENRAAALATARMSNPNIVNPLGSQTVSYTSGTDFDEAAYNAAMRQYQQDFANYQSARLPHRAVAPVLPTKEQFTTTIQTPTVTQTLTPDAQAALESQQRVQRALSGLGEQGIEIAREKLGMPFQYTGPEIQTNLGDVGTIGAAPNLESYGRAGAGVGVQGVNYGPGMGQYGYAQQGPSAGAYGFSQGGPAAENYMAAGGPAMGQYGMAQAGPRGSRLQRSLDTSGLAAMPVSAGMTAQQAILGRLQPQLQQQREQLNTQLINQGLRPGSEAYNIAMQQQSQRENDLLGQASLQGINVDMAARQQGLAEQQALGGFANQAALQQFGMGQQATQAYNQAVQQNMVMGMSAAEAQRAAAAQNFSQAQAATQMRNQAVGQNFAQGQAATQAYNQAVQQNMAMGLSASEAQNRAAAQLYGQQMGLQQLANAALSQNQQTALAQQQADLAAQNQRFNQALQAAQFGNVAAQQSLQQQLGLYNQPRNQISALMSGGQIQMPQFQGYQGANVASAPIFSAGQAQAQDAMARYNAEQASRNALTSGLFGLGSAALGAPSGGFLSKLIP
jgi:hypothetical protein